MKFSSIRAHLVIGADPLPIDPARPQHRAVSKDFEGDPTYVRISRRGLTLSSRETPLASASVVHLGDSHLSLPEDLQWLSVRLRRNHFCNWMNLHITHAADGEVEVHAPWREEFISNPDVRFTHGGILGTLVDTAASFAVATRTLSSEYTPRSGHVLLERTPLRHMNSPLGR